MKPARRISWRLCGDFFESLVLRGVGFILLFRHSWRRFSTRRVNYKRTVPGKQLRSFAHRDQGALRVLFSLLHLHLLFAV